MRTDYYKSKSRYRLAIHPLILRCLPVVLLQSDLPGPRESRSGPVHQVVSVLLGEQLVDDHDDGAVVGHLYLEGTELGEGIFMMNQNTLVILNLRSLPI